MRVLRDDKLATGIANYRSSKRALDKAQQRVNREAFKLVRVMYSHGLSYRNIAKRLGLSYEGVRLIHRGAWVAMILAVFTACTGGSFDSVQSSKSAEAGIQVVNSDATNGDSGTDTGRPETGPGRVLDSSDGSSTQSDSSYDSGLPRVSDAGVGVDSAQFSDSGAPTDSGPRGQLDSGPPALTCPTDATHCGGKSWTGNACPIGYGACCHADSPLCFCCLGG